MALAFTDWLVDGMVLSFNGFVAADGVTYMANDYFSSKNLFLCLFNSPSLPLAQDTHNYMRV